MLSTTNNERVDLRGKLYEEMCKIEGLEVEQSYDASNTLATKHDLFCVFFTMPDHLKKGCVIQMLRCGM